MPDKPKEDDDLDLGAENWREARDARQEAEEKKEERERYERGEVY